MDNSSRISSSVDVSFTVMAGHNFFMVSITGEPLHIGHLGGQMSLAIVDLELAVMGRLGCTMIPVFLEGDVTFLFLKNAYFSL